MSKQTMNLPDNPQIEVIKSGKTGLFTNYIYKAIPLAFDESMSYYECLCGLLDYLKNTIIPTVNNNADAVAELQSLYEELRTYVDNYFTNLDVQEEINNKLDKMAEDGTLDNILMNYTNITKVYNTFQDVLNDELILNQKIKTLGYYEINDNGGAEYYITDEKIENTIQIKVKNNKYATLVFDNEINIKQIGAKGDNIQDDTEFLLKAINTGRTVYIPKGNYKISDTINITTNNQKIYSDAEGIIYPDHCFDLFYLKNGRININVNVNGSNQLNGDNTKYIITIGKDNTNAALCVLNNCQITYIKQGAIKWEQGSMVQFNNCNIFNATGYGLYATTDYNDNNHGLLNNFRITGCDIGVYLEPTSTIPMGSQFHVFNNVKCFGCRQNFKIGTVYNYGTIFSEDSTDADELTSESYGNEFIYMGDQSESSRAVDNGRNTISFYTQSSSRTYNNMYFKKLIIKAGAGFSGQREISNPETLKYLDRIIGHTTVNVDYDAQNSAGYTVQRNDNFKGNVNISGNTKTTGTLQIGDTDLSTPIQRIYKGSISIGNTTFNAGETKQFIATYLGVNAVVLASLANGNAGLICSASNFSGNTVIYVTNTTNNSITTNAGCNINYIGLM